MVKIFLDTADINEIGRYAHSDTVQGFTTNPSLMRASGISEYRAFAKEVLALAAGRPVSLEVFADDKVGIVRQARALADIAPNVWVKIPVMLTDGTPTIGFLHELDEVHINLTAVMTVDQWGAAAKNLKRGDICSIFQGRIMDTMRRPLIPRYRKQHCDVLWASTREVYNLLQARDMGFDIITMAPALVAKLDLIGKSLEDYSLETVRQFYKDSEGMTL